MEAADETHKDSCDIDIFEADGYEDVKWNATERPNV